MRIDMHAHFVSRTCLDNVDDKGKRYGIGVTTNRKDQQMITFGGKALWPLNKEHWDAETRIKDMDAQGIDIQILGPSPALLGNYGETEPTQWLCSQQNDGVARLMKDYPKRFVGLAGIPLMDPAHALVELDRAVNKLGLRGITILTNTNGVYLDSPALEPFYKEVQTLDIPMFVHPSNVAARDRLNKYHFWNLIGNPLDTTITIGGIIFSGILEKFPRLKFCFSHAGGIAPYLRGRWEHGYEVRPECQAIIKRPPSYYFPNLYFDTITHFGPVLEFLVSSVGADRVLLGTDYPADMADSKPVWTVQSLVNVSQADKDKIMGGNAARIFKL